MEVCQGGEEQITVGPGRGANDGSSGEEFVETDTDGPRDFGSPEADLSEGGSTQGEDASEGVRPLGEEKTDPTPSAAGGGASRSLSIQPAGDAGALLEVSREGIASGSGRGREAPVSPRLAGAGKNRISRDGGGSLRTAQELSDDAADMGSPPSLALTAATLLDTPTPPSRKKQRVFGQRAEAYRGEDRQRTVVSEGGVNDDSTGGRLAETDIAIQRDHRADSPSPEGGRKGAQETSEAGASSDVTSSIKPGRVRKVETSRTAELPRRSRRLAMLHAKEAGDVIGRERATLTLGGGEGSSAIPVQASLAACSERDSVGGSAGHLTGDEVGVSLSGSRTSQISGECVAQEPPWSPEGGEYISNAEGEATEFVPFSQLF